MKKKIIVLMLSLVILTKPAKGFATTATIPGFYGQVQVQVPSINTLPVPQGNSFTGVASITTNSSKDQMVINQNQQYATINWNSFNIGANAVVYFNQKNAQGVAQTNWAALNRIYDQNPSVIFGSLKADGNVYLINQNGILFGPNSQVNVNSLIASTMNLRDVDFMNGVLNFTAENYQNPNYTPLTLNLYNEPNNNQADYNNAVKADLLLTAPNLQAMVANLGSIQTNSGGYVYLIAPDVENYGSINTPSGSSNLVSAIPLGPSPRTSDLFDIQVNPNTNTANYSTGVPGGFSANRAGGIITADSGFVGLFGKDVNQEGIIRAVTTLSQNGQIWLCATDQIYTAPGSQTLAPISDSTETLLSSSNFQTGSVLLTGINTVGSSNSIVYPSLIELWGNIEAPSGNVSISATNRVYLGKGSSISVGGMWVDEPAGANEVNAQLNSVELNNDYGQKNGILLGQNVNVNPLTGTAIGNLDANYEQQELTAQERSTTGGNINIGSNSAMLAQLIVMNGATLDFSGGGYRYAMGSVGTTMLVSGNTVVPLSSASEWATYNAIIGEQQVVHAKYGITQNYQGIYMGGGAPVGILSSNYVQGSDAGTLTLVARLQVLDGTLNGTATSGPFQTNVTTNTISRELSIEEGLEVPYGGSLTLGYDSPDTSSPQNNDFILGDIVVSQNATPLNSNFGPKDQLNRQQTILSASMLNAAGLSYLTLTTNTSLTLDANTHLELKPGGTLNVAASGVDLLGSIRIPAGTVNIDLYENKYNVSTSGSQADASYVPVTEQITLQGGSSIDVSGEQVNDAVALANGEPVVNARTAGGSINLEDLTDLGQGVFVNKGAVLDVSGGYSISPKGTLTGGNAGSLELLGNAVEVMGVLRGLALAGSGGGTLTLEAGTVAIGGNGAIFPPTGTAAVDDPGGLYIADGTLTYSGFSNLSFISRGDLTVGNGADLYPSLARFAPPAQGPDGAIVNTVFSDSEIQNIVIVDPTIAGSTSIALTSGVQFVSNRKSLRDLEFLPASSKLQVASGTTVQTPEGGTISISGPSVTVDGRLVTLGGTVDVTANSATGNLELGANASILANGYNEINSAMIGGVPAGWTPQNGGSVNLTSKQDLIIDMGSLIDVSGSQPVTINRAGANGAPVATVAASLPGNVTLSYGQEMTLDGKLSGGSNLAGLQGGSLNIESNVSMTTTSSQVALYQSWGFDDLTLGSATQITFADNVSINTRNLTINTPLLSAAADSLIDLKATYIIFENTATSVSTPPLIPGSAHLNATADWIDLTGELNFSGFKETKLTATNDIRLSDRSYLLGTYDASLSPISGYDGGLNLSGDLILNAAKTYPTTLSSFSIHTDGQITIGPGEGGSPLVVSAGGTLSLNAVNGIDVQGTLLAPMGEIDLTSSDGRILLEPGSLVSTVGDSSVSYGQLTVTGIWSTTNPNNVKLSNDVIASPLQNVQMTGKEVIVQNGARVDASGGGSVFSEVFQPGIEGSNNPLTGNYVIFPDNSIQGPGRAVYLASGDGIAAGVYTLFPAADYAFLPGAMVVTDLKTTVPIGVQQVTVQGLPVVAGYSTEEGTNLHSPLFEGYTIQPASVILKEGNFTTTELVAGSGGSITLNGTTTVLAGTVSASALTGFSGGSLEVGGQNITVGQSVAVLPEQFGFTTPLPVGISGTLLSTTSFVGKGFQELSLGASGSTDSVYVTAGSTVDVPNISITADSSINMGNGAQLKGVGADGSGSVTLASGYAVTFGDNSIIHAGNSFSLNVSTPSTVATPSTIDLLGTVSVDSGTASITGDRITLINNGETDRTGGGIFISQGQLNAFNNVTNLQLTSRGVLAFSGDLNLNSGGNVSIDAAGISGTGNVSLKATDFKLKNSSGNSLSTQYPNIVQTGSLAMQAEQITVGTGNVLFDGFGVVQLLATRNLTLQGTGSISTGWSVYDPSQRLELQGAQILSSLALNGNGTFSPADFTVNASNGTLAVTSSGAIPVAATAPGGYLALTANNINISGTIMAPGGSLIVTTSDTGPNSGISLSGNAFLSVAGVTVTPAVNAAPSSIPGGQVELSTGQGTFVMSQGTSIDVSGSGGSDAGGIVISAPQGANIQGNLLGVSNGGQGGSFTLDANQISNLDGLAGKLSIGGFTTTIDLRARGGDLSVDSGTTLSAREISLTADSGNITVAGSLTAIASSTSGTGGSVELYAGNALTVTGMVSATGAGSGAGGDVILSSEGGAVTLVQGSSINVSGASQGGTVTLRAPWINDGAVSQGNVDAVNISIGGNNSIAGAGQVIAQGVKIYNLGLLDGPGPYILDFNSIYNDMNTIMTTYSSSVLASLEKQSGLGAVLQLRPEMEVQAPGDLTVASDIILANISNGVAPLRFTNNEPGILTLRAAGDLVINGNIIDAPSVFPTIINNKPSWGINLVAGADLTSANLMSTQQGQGTLTIEDGYQVYTESAPLRFASGGDTNIGASATSGLLVSGLPLTLGTSVGNVWGKVGGNLILGNNGVILSATGAINLDVGKDLSIGDLGAILTTGESLNQSSYVKGGAMNVNVGGAVGMVISAIAWDAVNYDYDNGNWYWSANYGSETSSNGYTTSGIATMGGGDLYIRCATSFNGQAGTFGAGNFTLVSGGDVQGLFLVNTGKGNIMAGGSFGSAAQPENTGVELLGAQVNVTAGGRIDVGTISNPTLTNSNLYPYWDLTYTYAGEPSTYTGVTTGSQDSSIRLSALTGGITLTGASSYLGSTTDTPTDAARKDVLPPSVELYAAQGIYIQNSFSMAPSPTGNLQVASGGDIEGQYTDTLGNVQRGLIYMSDQDPLAVYAPLQIIGQNSNQAATYETGYDIHAGTPVHSNDPTPVLISAAGDISDLDIYLPKQADLVAGGDVRDIYASFQNVTSQDETEVLVGKDIIFSAGNAAYQGVNGISVGGPGQLLIQAGGNIDLGTSLGIQAVGNFQNFALPANGSSVIVAAGVNYSNYQFSVSDEQDLFSSLRQMGSEYADLKAQGDAKDAIATIVNARTDLIDPRFSGGVNNGNGSVEMVNSSISTLSAASDIYILARSQIDVGTSTFISSAQLQASGIFTASGGSINIFSGGDLNVNESRVMTYLGGDITTWSDQGSINAGRGSKTAINSQPPVYNPITQKFVFTPPSAGSGVRALTYDPTTASAGDIYLFAPQGVIDAGEAGISGGKIILGATQVLNAKNISFSVSSVGVPAPESSVSLGSLAGAGSVAETSKMVAQSSALGSNENLTQQTNVVDQFLSQFLDVKVINFDTDEGNTDNDKQKEEKRKKK